uniref:Uncharacterized protein n=1 Tax=Ditylenchus dipsaci TaxID=166011 RepID=A0A915DHS1_9BILA
MECLIYEVRAISCSLFVLHIWGHSKNQIRTSIPSMTALSTTTTTNGGGQHMQQDKKVAVLQLGSVEDVRCSGGGNGQLVIG